MAPDPSLRCRSRRPALPDRTGVLAPYANRDSGYHGKAKGRWPIHVDPDDVSRVFFLDPQTKVWHALWWEHQPVLGTPFSADALTFAKHIALSNDKFPDIPAALAELLQRWQVGLADTPAERRIALRAAAAQAALPLPSPSAPHTASQTADRESSPQMESADETSPAEASSTVDTESFYADAWQALQ